MRRIVKCAIALTAVLGATGAQAQNYPWCAQYTGDMGGSMNCGFTSFDQCMTTVRGMGGFCIANNTYVPPPGLSRPSRTVSKHSAQKQS
jgi:hypothetical protein